MHTNMWVNKLVMGSASSVHVFWLALDRYAHIYNMNIWYIHVYTRTNLIVSFCPVSKLAMGSGKKREVLTAKNM